MKIFTKGTNTTVFARHAYYEIQLWKKLGRHFLSTVWSLAQSHFIELFAAGYDPIKWPEIMTYSNFLVRLFFVDIVFALRYEPVS